MKRRPPLHVWHVHRVSTLQVFAVLAGDRPERYAQWPYTSVTARTEAEAISKVFIQQMALEVLQCELNMPLQKTTKFWFVWSPRGWIPKRKHESLAHAAAEAERLSKKRPGRHFYVLELVGYHMEGPEIPTANQQRRAQEACATKETGV